MKKLIPPCWLNVHSGIIFHAAWLFSANKPPCFLSEIIIFFFLLVGLPSQIKLKMILLILSTVRLDIVNTETL